MLILPIIESSKMRLYNFEGAWLFFLCCATTLACFQLATFAIERSFDIRWHEEFHDRQHTFSIWGLTLSVPKALLTWILSRRLTSSTLITSTFSLSFVSDGSLLNITKFTFGFYCGGMQSWDVRPCCFLTDWTVLYYILSPLLSGPFFNLFCSFARQLCGSTCFE